MAVRSPSHPRALATSHPCTRAPSHPHAPSHPRTLTPLHSHTLAPSHPRTLAHVAADLAHSLALFSHIVVYAKTLLAWAVERLLRGRVLSGARSVVVIVASQPTRRCAEGTARLEAAKRSGGWYPAARMTWCGEVCRAAGRWSGGHSAHASQLSDEQSITIVSFGRYNTNVHPFADLARIGCAPTTCRRQTHLCARD